MQVFLLVCGLASNQCETHTLNLPQAPLLACMLSQAEIAQTYPLRGDQYVKEISCGKV